MTAGTSLRRTGIVLLAALALPLAGCGASEEPVAETTSQEESTAAAPAPEPSPAETTTSPTPDATSDEGAPGETTDPADDSADEPVETTDGDAGGGGDQDDQDGGGDQGGGGSGTGTGTTTVTGLKVFGSDGYPTADWSIEDQTSSSPTVCGGGSPFILEGLGTSCGSSADYGLACLANPLADDEVICVTDAINHRGYRRTVEGEVGTDIFDGPRLPLAITLTDGSTWRARSGGAARETPDGFVPFYYCETGCEDSAALYGPASGDPLDRSDDQWAIRFGADNGQETTTWVDVDAVYFVVGTGID